MKKLTLDGLEDCFRMAEGMEWNYVGVKIQMEGFEKPEVIINPKENFRTKLDYYKKAYNNDLVLKTFNGIRIIDYCYADSYEEIQNGF